MSSQRQIEANRRNAQRSTGPQTAHGRAAVRLNALKHGLTAREAVISDEERPAFNETLAAFHDHLQPLDPVQCALADQIVMAAWRLRRLRGIETRLFDLRMLDLASHMDDDHAGLDSHARHAYVFLNDTRGPNALTTLSRYETRTERAFYRALHELQRLQRTPQASACDNATNQTHSQNRTPVETAEPAPPLTAPLQPS